MTSITALTTKLRSLPCCKERTRVTNIIKLNLTQSNYAASFFFLLTYVFRVSQLSNRNFQKDGLITNIPIIPIFDQF